MCTSVPQIVVVVTLINASPGLTLGIGFSSRTILPGSTNTAALMVRMTILSKATNQDLC
jgi:hypothetical protein